MATRKPAQSARASHKRLIDAFPAIAQWVQERGWIEIGEQEVYGFIVRALDEGGVCYEDEHCTNLDEAMRSLENGIKAWMAKNR